MAKKQTVAFLSGHGVYHGHSLREMAYILSCPCVLIFHEFIRYLGQECSIFFEDISFI